MLHSDPEKIKFGSGIQNTDLDLDLDCVGIFLPVGCTPVSAITLDSQGLRDI